jgi:hypothetical protein
MLGAITEHLNNRPQLRALFGGGVLVGSPRKFFPETLRVSAKNFVARLTI